MRVAVCFSGHVRNFFEKGLDNFYDNFLYLREHGHQVDLFFSVWNTCDATVSYSANTENFSIKVSDALITQLNPAAYLIEDYDSIKHRFLLKSLHPTIEPESSQIIHEDILHSTPMFYKIWSANSLKTQYEKENNFKYDVVVRYRAQLYMRSPLEPEQVQPNTLYLQYTGIDYQHDSFMTDDLFAYGDSQIMDIYSEIYPNLSMLLHKYGNTGPERLMDNWVSRYLNLNIKPSIKLDLLR
jgi:hypothetical protein